MRQKPLLIIIGIAYYTVLIFDFVSLAILGRHAPSKGQCGIYIALFIIERLAQMAWKIYQDQIDDDDSRKKKNKKKQNQKNKKKSDTNKDAEKGSSEEEEDEDTSTRDVIFALFFIDFAYELKEEWLYTQELLDADEAANQQQAQPKQNQQQQEQQKQQQQQQQQLQNKKPKPDVRTERRDALKIRDPPHYLETLLIRAFSVVLIGAFLNVYAQVVRIGGNGGLIAASFFQILLFAIANGEYYFRRDGNVSLKERVFVTGVVFVEMWAKIGLWAFFCHKTEPKGVWVLFVLELVFGFFGELVLQCNEMAGGGDDDQGAGSVIKQASFFKQLFFGWKKLAWWVKVLFLPGLVALQTAFYARFEHIMAERADVRVDEQADREDTLFKLRKGDWPIVFRLVELFVLAIIGGLAVKKAGQAGYYVVGVLAYVMDFAYSAYLIYWRMYKKDDQRHIVKLALPSDEVSAKKEPEAVTLKKQTKNNAPPEGGGVQIDTAQGDKKLYDDNEAKYVIE